MEKYPEILQEQYNNRYLPAEFLQEEMKSNIFRDAELLETCENLLDKLENKALTYGSVLGDDASGRIPALLIRRFINHRREEKGLKPIEGYFVGSGHERTKGDMEAIGKFLSNKKNELGKVLIVTEFIDTGEAMSALINIIKQLDISFKIAAVSIGGEPESYSFIKKIIFGEVGNSGANFYNEKAEFSGVKKSFKGREAHASKDVNEGNTDAIHDAREDINLFLENYYKKTSPLSGDV